jgi:hypothetical protein
LAQVRRRAAPMAFEDCEMPIIALVKRFSPVATSAIVTDYSLERHARRLTVLKVITCTACSIDE